MSSKPMTRLTAGPASATASSCAGSLGRRCMLATPPIGSKVTVGVLIP